MGFPNIMMKWISACIHTPMFSVLVNGSPAGYFKGGRGIRQGDPLSPYLFTLCMEPLSVLLDDAVSCGKMEIPHRCKALSISHLMFADDLMLFSKAKALAISGIMDILRSFSSFSGLEVNPSESSIILGGVDPRTKAQIQSASGFQLGELPISYLGVPLVQASIVAKDCEPIITKIRGKIEGWKCRFLSHAGRLQLITAVLQSSYLYWAGLFGLPRKTCSTIEALLAKFLWSGPELKKKTHLVSWDKICLPKSEGGLGIRRVKDSCTAGVMKRVWEILEDKNSIWVQWMKRKYIKKDSYWTVKMSKNHPWIWRNMLLQRDMMKRKVSYCMGSGANTLFWLDPWLGDDPLWNRIENAASLIPLQSKMESVQHFWEGDNWRACPHPNNRSFQVIWDELTQVKLLASGREDKVLWKTTKGSDKRFSTKEGWESCRNSGPIVQWNQAIWFTSYIPKHSFVSWRACLDALPTAEQLQKRSIDIPHACRLCDDGVDSNHHLFFECKFSSFIWKKCMSRCFPRIGRPSTCTTEASRLATIKGKGSHISCIPKIMFNGIVYHIWQERNRRSFGGKRKTMDILCRDITSQVEDKVAAMTFHRPGNLLESFLCTNWHIDVH